MRCGVLSEQPAPFRGKKPWNILDLRVAPGLILVATSIPFFSLTSRLAESPACVLPVGANSMGVVAKNTTARLRLRLQPLPRAEPQPQLPPRLPYLALWEQTMARRMATCRRERDG